VRALLPIVLLLTLTACGTASSGVSDEDGRTFITIETNPPVDEEMIRAEQERLANLPTDVDWEKARNDRLREVAEANGWTPEPVVNAAGDIPVGWGTVIVRTDFAHPQEWDTALGLLRGPTPEGYVTTEAVVDHERWAGAGVPDLVAADPDAIFLVLDEVTLTNPDYPVLVTNGSEELRVIATEAATVEANLAIANMDWFEFRESADADGVFRAF
jgi:hypothetical protein